MRWLSRLLERKPESSHQPRQRFAELVPADWASSSPHLAVLERFLSPRNAHDGVPEYWEPMFGAHPRHIVQGLLELNLLEPASLMESIEYCHTGAELKRLLAEKGVKASGKKADQSQRLVAADPEGASRLLGNREILRCTPAAREIVESWLDRKTRDFEVTTDEAIAALRHRQYKVAIQIADRWLHKQFQAPVHPKQSAITIPREARTIDDRVAELARIFTLRPNILKGLNPGEWEGLHLNYAVWQLLGKSANAKCIPGFTGLGAMDLATVMLMMSFHERHRSDLERWREIGVKRASIWCTKSGSCGTCMALDQKAYYLDDLPELPYESCTCALGCRCFYVADLDSIPIRGKS